MKIIYTLFLEINKQTDGKWYISVIFYKTRNSKKNSSKFTHTYSNDLDCWVMHPSTIYPSYPVLF
jgi:hypothetical protein